MLITDITLDKFIDILNSADRNMIIICAVRRALGAAGTGLFTFQKNNVCINQKDNITNIYIDYKKEYSLEELDEFESEGDSQYMTVGQLIDRLVELPNKNTVLEIQRNVECCVVDDIDLSDDVFMINTIKYN